MKRIVCLAVVLAMVSVASVSFGQEKRIAVCLPTQDQPHFISMAWGYRDEAPKVGAKVTLYDAGGYVNVEKQVRQIEDAVASKVDAIILISVSMTGTIQAVDEAVKAGIPVINVNVMCNSNNIIARIRSDDSEIGRIAAEALAKSLNNKGNIVLLPGKAGASVIMMRYEAFKNVMKKYPNITILGEQFSEMTRPDGLRIMEDMIQTHGGKINGLWAVSEHLTMGAVMAMEAAKMKNVKVFTGDFSDDLFQKMREGKIHGTVLQQPILMARMALKTTMDVLNKKKVPPITFTPIKLITAEEVDKVDRSGFEMPKK